MKASSAASAMLGILPVERHHQLSSGSTRYFQLRGPRGKTSCSRSQTARTNVVPGVFVANGHDYRADLARFVREVYDLQATDAQLARVKAALREYEIIREKLTEGIAQPDERLEDDGRRDEIAA